jgi:Tfp pilus assembly protein FimT
MVAQQLVSVFLVILGAVAVVALAVLVDLTTHQQVQTHFKALVAQVALAV